MNSRTYDCICAGIIVADHVCAAINRLPAPGELVLSDRLELSIGGCASNVAVDLARLGRNPVLMGCVGTDVFGDFVRSAMEAEGVNCQHLLQSRELATSGTLVVNTKGEDRRFIHSVGANAAFTGREVPESLISDARILYLGGYRLVDAMTADSVIELFEKARRAGVTTVLDVVIPDRSDHWPHVAKVLPYTDIFLPNDDEAAIITGLDDPLKQAARFREAGAGTVVITEGDRGAIVAEEGRTLRAGSFPAEFIDGTGSGDAFVAGYLYGLLDGRDTTDCLKLGSALGCSCVQATGATTGIFTADELAEFLARHELHIEEI